MDITSEAAQYAFGTQQWWHPLRMSCMGWMEATVSFKNIAWIGE
jgi:hypothetical protein